MNWLFLLSCLCSLQSCNYLCINLVVLQIGFVTSIWPFFIYCKLSVKQTCCQEIHSQERYTHSTACHLWAGILLLWFNRSLTGLHDVSLSIQTHSCTKAVQIQKKQRETLSTSLTYHTSNSMQAWNRDRGFMWWETCSWYRTDGQMSEQSLQS